MASDETHGADEFQDTLAADESPASANDAGEEVRGEGRPSVDDTDEAGRDAELFAHALTDLRTGEIVRGKVVSVQTDSVLVDVGYKSEGIIPLREYSYRHVEDAHEIAREGDEIEAMVLSLDREEGTLRLSRRRAEEARAWGRLKEAFESGQVLEAPVVESVKGGLVCDVGTRGFLPASQVDRGFANDLERFVGQSVRVRIIELDRAKHRVILSRRVVVEEERTQARQEIWSRIHEGDLVSGTVKSLTDFGAFIDLGGVDGLLHVSELSWGRVAHPSEVLKEGDSVTVRVIRLDPEHDRISLSLREAQPNPWDLVTARYPVDSIHEARVVRLANFGAFVELEPGIDGLVHVSELSDRHVNRPSEVVAVGDPVTVKVLRVSPEERRVSLTMRGVHQTGGLPATDLRHGGAEDLSGYTVGDHLHGRDF